VSIIECEKGMDKLKAAKAMSPPILLARVDEVIE